MKPRTIFVLTICTLVISLGAVVAALLQPGSGEVELEGDLAFPELRERSGDIVTVRIVRGDDTLTLARDEDGWSLDERAGYPADAAKVRDTLATLAQMRFIEAKTTKPDLYPRLEVEDPGEDAASRRVVIESGDGEAVLDLVVGKQRLRLTGMEDAGTYVRRHGDGQSWLASGGLQIGIQPSDWLERTVMTIDPDLIASLEIDPPEAEAFRVGREDRDADLDLVDLEEGESGSSDLARIGTSLADLMLADVRQSETLQWPEATGTVALTTFDGLKLDFRLAEIGGEPWLEILDVAVSPAPAPTDDTTGDEVSGAGQDSAEEEVEIEAEASNAGASDAGASDVGTSDSRTLEAGPEPEEMGAYADALRERTQGWAYAIPSWIYDRLTRPRDGWLQDEDEGTS